MSRRLPFGRRRRANSERLSGSYDLILWMRPRDSIFTGCGCGAAACPGRSLMSDNVLQEGELIESHYLVERRNRTIYKRMREYLYELKHHPQLMTSIIPLGDGVSLSVKEEA